MVRVRRRKGPVDYSLCNQTVTVYHRAADGAISRMVIKNAFLDFRKVQGVGKTGSTEANGSLLVIPCPEIPVSAGDKVLPGVGPEIASREAWAGFIPAKVPGLAVIKWVDPKYFQGRMVHVEAGG